MSNTIFIIAHAPLANALRDCAMHVYPECAHEVIALDVMPNAQPEETLRLANLALQNVPQDGLLVLTDIFGGGFPCNVWISKGDRRVNAKSIMGVMMLAAGIGTEVTLETDGDQEQAAMDALEHLFNDKFGEGE